MAWYQRWAPYKPVAQRRAEAMQFAKRLTKKGESLSPVKISGRAMATTFWGIAWCDNLERYSDYENRLPRGRTYARNGSIIDLKIQRGQITAMVSGSSIYKIKISIDPLDARRWKNVRADCAASIHSLLDLMRGKFSDDVMRRLTDAKTGLFPEPKQIKLSCSCPDGAYLCKHLAAVMYGIGHRLDNSPEMFFELRGVDHRELIEEALSSDKLDRALAPSETVALASEDLGAMFGIDLDTNSVDTAAKRVATKPPKTKKASGAMKAISRKLSSPAIVKAIPTGSKGGSRGRRAKAIVQPAATVKTSAAVPKVAATSVPKAKKKALAK